MGQYTLKFTPEFAEDLHRLFDYLIESDQELLFAEKVLEEIIKHLNQLSDFPYNYRKVEASNPYFREILIPFGKTGYVAMFEIEDDANITVLAIRHQREADYH